MQFLRGDPVWFAHEEDGFRAGLMEEFTYNGKTCKVFDCIANTHVTVENNAQALQARHEGYGMGSHDMSNMGELSDASILWNLGMRFKKDQIYTNIGPILVAVNPYRHVNCTLNEKTPGILRTVCKIYDEMLENKESHACVVTGESGAGKTESVKLFVNQLATLSIRRSFQMNNAQQQHPHHRRNSSQIRHQHTLQERIVQVGPILESFGNAKTIRNENSSRFGKWIEVEIDFNSGQPISGTIRNYLLEKSRIVRLAPGERNFHIFYQLLSDPGLCQTYGLDCDNYEAYRILRNSAKVSMVDDRDGLDQLQNAMAVVGLKEQEVAFVFQTISAVLHLGNVEVEENAATEKVEINPAQRDLFLQVCREIGLESTELEQAILFRTIENLHECILTPRTLKEAKVTMDALIKSIYHSLFEWITERINVSLDGIADAIENATHEDPHAMYGRMVESGFIGILDAFGFEIFATNSFEQLCINYCNEKMQLHFNRIVFEREILDYQHENILKPGEVDQFKSQHSNVEGSIDRCISLLEDGQGYGLFALIDDELKVPNGTDRGLYRKLINKHMDHPNFHRKPNSANLFTISHYAGNVTYTIDGFLAKSTDPLPKQIQLVCARSTNSYFKSSFPTCSEIQELHKGGKSKKSLGTQFKQQLNYLSKLIFQDSHPHFIRCIKPNDQAEPRKWHGQRVLEQVRYAGLLEACKIRARGYPVNYLFKDFVAQFGHNPKAHTKENVVALCQELENCGAIEHEKYRVGDTKIFLRSKQDQMLRNHRYRTRFKAAVLLEKVFRGYIIKNSVRNYLDIKTRLRRSMETEDENKIRLHVEELKEYAQSNFAVLPTEALIKHGEIRLQQLGRVNKLESKLKQAMLDDKDWERFCQAVDDCDAYGVKSDLVTKAHEIRCGHVHVLSILDQLSEKVDFLSRKVSPRDSSLDRRKIKTTIHDIRAIITNFNQNLKPKCFTGEEQFDSLLERSQRICDTLEKESYAITIQRFFKRVIQRNRARVLLAKLSATVKEILSAMDARNVRLLDAHLTEIDRLGFGKSAADPHPIVPPAVALHADIRLAMLGSINQLERLTKKLSRKLAHRERKLAAKPNMVIEEDHPNQNENQKASTRKENRKKKSEAQQGHQHHHHAKKKPSRFNTLLRSVPILFAPGKRIHKVRKSDYELLVQAIDKAKKFGVDDQNEVMQQALDLVARLEAIRNTKRGAALRMFSNNSLLSSAQSTSTINSSFETDTTGFSNEEEVLMVLHFDEPSSFKDSGSSNSTENIPLITGQEGGQSFHAMQNSNKTQVLHDSGNEDDAQNGNNSEVTDIDDDYDDDDDNVSDEEEKAREPINFAKKPTPPSLAAKVNETVRRTLSVQRLLPRTLSKKLSNTFLGSSSKEKDNHNSKRGKPVELVFNDEVPCPHDLKSPTSCSTISSATPRSVDTLYEDLGCPPTKPRPTGLPPRPTPKSRQQQQESSIVDDDPNEDEDDILKVSVTDDGEIQIPNEVNSCVQRAIYDRICREREMRKVIESRYWENRRGISVVHQADAVQGYNNDIANDLIQEPKEYSFSSMYSDKSKSSGNAVSFHSDINNSEKTLHEQQNSKVHKKGSYKNRYSMESMSSVGSTIPRHSLKAYKQHWETLSFVNANVVYTKTF